MAVPALAFWLLSQMSSFNRGREYERLGDISQAINCYSQALKENPRDTESKYRLFLIFESSGEVEQAHVIAIELARIASIGEKKLITIHTFLLNYNMGRSDFKEMYLDSRKLCFLGATNFNAFLFLAKVFGGNGKMDEFSNYIAAALKLIPDHEEAQYLYALYLFSDGQRKEGRSILENMARSMGDSIKPYMALAGNSHYDDPLAASIWLSAIDDKTNNMDEKTDALILLGICQIRLKQYSDALRNFNRVLNSDSKIGQQTYQALLFSLAWCHYLLEQFREAEEMMKKLVAINFSFSDALQKFSMTGPEIRRDLDSQFVRIYAGFPKASLLNELSFYNGMDLKTLDREFKDWRVAFEGNSRLKWVQFAKDFQDMNLNEFIAAANFLIDLLGYKVDRTLDAEEGFMAIATSGEGKIKTLVQVFTWGTKVSDIVIAETALRMSELDVTKGVLILPGTFSNQARIDAEIKGISLFDGNDIDHLLIRMD
jgi:tetratricopeptide (TPR) repeat protein